MDQEYFRQAELALAAYANLLPGVNVKDELKITDFSDVQADAFVFKYRVITQHTDATGLSVTVFKSTDTENPQTFLAILGTETNDSGDIFAGLSIAIFGATVMQPQYASLKAQVQSCLSDGTLSQTFTVTGHKLGGYGYTDL